jgi:hypothetical protein
VSVPLLAGPAWALLAFIFVRYASASAAWNDTHRFALSFGAVLGCIAMADATTAGWTQIDLIAKYVFQILAIVGFLLLGLKVSRRENAARA